MDRRLFYISAYFFILQIFETFCFFALFHYILDMTTLVTLQVPNTANEQKPWN